MVLMKSKVFQITISFGYNWIFSKKIFKCGLEISEEIEVYFYKSYEKWERASERVFCRWDKIRKTELTLHFIEMNFTKITRCRHWSQSIGTKEKRNKPKKNKNHTEESIKNFFKKLVRLIIARLVSSDSPSATIHANEH